MLKVLRWQQYYTWALLVWGTPHSSDGRAWRWSVWGAKYCQQNNRYIHLLGNRTTSSLGSYFDIFYKIELNVPIYSNILNDFKSAALRQRHIVANIVIFGFPLHPDILLLSQRPNLIYLSRPSLRYDFGFNKNLISITIKLLNVLRTNRLRQPWYNPLMQ